MIHCRGCGQPIHETAPSCPHCGALQAAPVPVETSGTLWLPVPAFVCGLLAVVGQFDDQQPARELALGAVLFSGIAIALATAALARQKRARGLAIAAVVLGVIGLLVAAGTLL